MLYRHETKSIWFGPLQSSSLQQAEDKEGIRASNSKLQREAEASKFKYKANAEQFLHSVEVGDQYKSDRS